MDSSSARVMLRWAVAVVVLCLLPGCRTRLLEGVGSDGGDVSLEGRGTALGLIALADGSLALTGSSATSPEQVLFGRFHADGTPDTRVGPRGTRVSDLAPTGSSVAFGIGAQRDGRLVVAGRSWKAGEDPRFLVARFDDIGQLDASFQGGSVSYDPLLDTGRGRGSSSEAFAIAITDDGGILAAGNAANYHGGSGTYWADLAVIRLNPDGSLDRTFGVGGAAIVEIGGSASARHVMVDKGGRIVVAGYASFNGQIRVALVGLLPGGALDPGFGNSGVKVVSKGLSDQAYDIAALPGGGYLLTGQTADDDRGTGGNILTAGIDPLGRLDANFGILGWTVTQLPGGVSAGRGVFVEAKSYLLGGWATGAEGNPDFALLRLDSTGQPYRCRDQPSELVRAITPGQEDFANAMAVQPDGTPVLAGRTGDQLAVRRFPEFACP